ncbi:MAG: hypothetical protein IJT74_01650 [Bacteroidales bacterium]|nr:hypothetical protein [Bacteroidales bacterium]
MFGKVTFSKQADNEIVVAERIASTLTKASNPREEIKKILSHMESAYVTYKTRMYTLDVWDWKSVIYKKAGKRYCICESIAALHHQIGK